MRDSFVRQRGVSPVIGVVLMVVVVALLAAIAGGMILGMTDDPDPAPATTFSIEAAGSPGSYEIAHKGGDRVEADRVGLRGAVDERALGERTLTAGERQSVYAVDETIEVVWTGDDGTSYVIWEFDLIEDTDTARNSVSGAGNGTTIPEPDEGCEWVENASDGGVDPVKINGLTVACDVETAEGIEVQDGVVIGETVSGAKDVDADDAQFYGEVAVENVFNLQHGLVAGSIDSATADVKVEDGTVDGPVSAAKVVEIVGSSSVNADVSGDGTVKVHDSTVDGSIASEDSVDLQNATVKGDVYVDATDFTCSDSMIGGEDCGTYAPEGPSNS